MFTLARDLTDILEGGYVDYCLCLFMIRNKVYNRMLDDISLLINKLKYKLKVISILNYLKFVDDILWPDFAAFKEGIDQRLPLMHSSAGYAKAIEVVSEIIRQTADA